MRLGHAKEDCLKAILLLGREIKYVRSVDVARRLGLSKPTVCSTTNALEKMGYVDKAPPPNFILTLTDHGKKTADKIYEKHCFFKALLLRAGIEEAVAEQEACELEHAISDESFDTLRQATVRRSDDEA